MIKTFCYLYSIVLLTFVCAELHEKTKLYRQNAFNQLTQFLPTLEKQNRTISEEQVFKMANKALEETFSGVRCIE